MNAPQKVFVGFAVSDPEGLWTEARQAYLTSGGGDESGVIGWLGTQDAPDLSHCIQECINAEAPWFDYAESAG